MATVSGIAFCHDCLVEKKHTIDHQHCETFHCLVVSCHVEDRPLYINS